MKKIRRCAVCGAFTLLPSHCGQPSESAHPARFNPHDKYARFRRKEKGLE